MKQNNIERKQHVAGIKSQLTSRVEMEKKLKENMKINNTYQTVM